MTLTGKKRLAAVALVLFALWPLAHHVLVARYDMNPWKFFGWSMYCVPDTTITLDITATRSGRDYPLDERNLPRLQPAIRSYITLRKHLGQLMPPDGIARNLLRMQPAPDEVRIDIHRLQFDAETATFQTQTKTYRYTPEGRK